MVVCWTVTQWTQQDLSCDIKMCNLLRKLRLSLTTGTRGRKDAAPFPWQCQSPGRTCTERENSRKVQWFLGSESITLAALLQQQSCSSSCRWQLELCGNLVKSLSCWLMQGRYKIWIRIFYLESLFQKALIVKAPSLGSLTVRRSRAILLSENNTVINTVWQFLAILPHPSWDFSHIILYHIMIKLGLSVDKFFFRD